MNILDYVPHALLFVVCVSVKVRDYYQRKLIRMLVFRLHRNGNHWAAHEVRHNLLPRELPTALELELERDIEERR